MKKIVLFIVLICFLSVVSAMEAEPFTKEDFKQRMDTAIQRNERKLSLTIPYDEFGEIDQDEVKRIQGNLGRLDELREQAIKEYNLFFDAYYSADSQKVHAQTEKLEKIFDEMNSLMVTVINFDVIYASIYFWSLQLDYYIEHGIFNPDKNADYPKRIEAVNEKTGAENQITDCCVSDPLSDCCKIKKNAECCITNPDSDCCKEKPSQDNLLIPVAIALVIIVIALLYVAFIKKS